MKLLRIIRFDGSDDFVFESAAQPDEWALPGGFEFAGIQSEHLVGKTRQAFTNGFLGLPSMGRSTFAVIADITEEEEQEMCEILTDHFVNAFGAPDKETGNAAAREEIAFVADMCADQPINTVFTLRRVLDEDGEVREEFRIITPPSEPIHTRVWDVVEDDA